MYSTVAGKQLVINPGAFFLVVRQLVLVVNPPFAVTGIQSHFSLARE